jgi:CheY-like chemotaxis protein
VRSTVNLQEGGLLRGDDGPLILAAMTGRGTILVIDDEREIRETLGQALREAGYEVISFAGGRAALEYLRGEVLPDVIVLDLLMPDFDGWDFRADQRRDPPIASVPVLSFSAIGKLVDGATSLRKPADLDEIIQAIETAETSGLIIARLARSAAEVTRRMSLRVRARSRPGCGSNEWRV